MSRLIACGHCGGGHPTIAEVRACATDHPVTDAGPPPEDQGWTEDEPVDTGERPRRHVRGRGEQAAARPRSTGEQRGRRRDPADSDDGPARSAGPSRPARRSGPVTRRPVIEADAAALAGPPALGRSVLVGPDQPAPAPWAGADRLVVDPAAPEAVLPSLHEAWLARRPLVIELHGDLPPDDPVLSVPFWELAADTELPGERLRFLLTANTVDARRPEAARFDPIERAVGAGASFAGPADVVLADGVAAWVDGGPLDPLDPAACDGHPIVPRAHLVAGQLRPLPDARPTTAELAPDQLAAVTHRRGPARIIAPAGSGKTRVLTERTRHLVRDRGVAPTAVSLVAYNRRARQEMGERLADVPGLDIRTLNSLALAIATGRGPFRRPGGEGPNLTTIDERDARRLLEGLVPSRRRRALTDPLEAWIDALSACRLGLRHPDDIEAEYADVSGFADVLDRYRRELRRRGALDFDEQVIVALEVLLTDPAAREVARAAAPVLLVDEFQDLTPAHVLLVRLLAGPATEVFGVGDDDQTIYGYTGASPEWLVDFTRYFPGAVDHPLTVNYRCPPAVVDGAVNLLSHNRFRVTKEIHPAPGRRSAAGELRIERPADPDRALVDHVTALLDGGGQPGDVAVLARVNAALLPPLLFLDQAGIPVRRPPGVDVHLLDRSGTGAALAWLRLATAPERGLAAGDLRLALRRPPRSLHPRVADWVCEQRSVKELVALSGRINNERDSDTIADFAADIARLRQAASDGHGAAELLDVVYHDIGLYGAASQLDSSQRTARRAAHADELRALRAVAPLHDDPGELDQWLRSRLVAVPRHADDGDRDAVSLATIHATKGLEWPHVVVHDARRDLHPHHLAIDVEEERRVFHVAVTRGRDSVLVLASAPPSPFLDELARPRPAGEPWPADRPVVSSRSAPSDRPAKAARAADPTPAHEALRAWRLKLARRDKVPPYVVFNDATLDAIVDADPTSLVQLGRVKGIGPAKLDRYGDEILGVLAEFRS